MPEFPPKPPAPSVRMTLGNAIARVGGWSERRALSQQEVVMELIATLDLPEPLKVRLRNLHRIEET